MYRFNFGAVKVDTQRLFSATITGAVISGGGLKIESSSMILSKGKQRMVLVIVGE